MAMATATRYESEKVIEIQESDSQCNRFVHSRIGLILNCSIFVVIVTTGILLMTIGQDAERLHTYGSYKNTSVTVKKAACISNLDSKTQYIVNIRNAHMLQRPTTTQIVSQIVASTINTIHRVTTNTDDDNNDDERYIFNVELEVEDGENGSPKTQVYAYPLQTMNTAEICTNFGNYLVANHMYISPNSPSKTMAFLYTKDRTYPIAIYPYEFMYSLLFGIIMIVMSSIAMLMLYFPSRTSCCSNNFNNCVRCITPE